ncbi:MAG TPA: tRNA guanosine(34) transglycosylase Tgt [Candidatus Paceibacterota bacterium]|nr:tRNA guanosine(34) transglycosylase Tgt [Candidatus Paceibacterota bacterium]
MFSFKIEKKIDGALGRAGVISTPHGDIQTPAFIVVGTKATVKALTPEQISELGAQAVLANTYHLYLQPGDEIVAKAGGFPAFMNWQGPTFTDSGGFQAFSLGAALGHGISKLSKGDEAVETRGESEHVEHLRAKIDDEGVTFKSVIDGSTHHFTPERSMQIQHNLAADIIFAFDECTSPTASYDYQKVAMNRTHAWAERSLAEHKRLGGEQALFGIVQGGRYRDLREESARAIGAMDFPGFGIGGSFDEQDLGTAVAWVNTILPEGRPRHLLGIGEPEDFFTGIENGVDTFDCVAPSRMARNGSLQTKRGRINVLNSGYREDFSPIEEGCRCYTCRNYSKAYLAHLFRAKEMLAGTLATIHNLYFSVNLVKEIRQSIVDGRFAEFKEEFLAHFNSKAEAQA